MYSCSQHSAHACCNRSFVLLVQLGSLANRLTSETVYVNHASMAAAIAADVSARVHVLGEDVSASWV